MANNPNVIPASVQQLPGYELSYGQPDPLGKAFGIFASGLQGVTERKQLQEKTKQAQMTAAFPSMVAQGMVAPWEEGVSQGEPIPYGGSQWALKSPDQSMGYDSTLKQLRIEQLTRTLADEYGFTDEDTQDRIGKYVTTYLGTARGSAEFEKILHSGDPEKMKELGKL